MTSNNDSEVDIMKKVQVTVRFTQDEKKKLDEIAKNKGLSLSETIKNSLFSSDSTDDSTIKNETNNDTKDDIFSEDGININIKNESNAKNGTIQILTQQLEIKDKQIEEKDEQIKKLFTLLYAKQVEKLPENNSLPWWKKIFSRKKETA